MGYFMRYLALFGIFGIFLLFVACGSNANNADSTDATGEDAGSLIAEIVEPAPVVITPPQQNLVEPPQPKPAIPPTQLTESPGEESGEKQDQEAQAPSSSSESTGNSESGISRMFAGVVKEVGGQNRDRGRIQASQGQFYHFYGHSGLMFGDAVTFEIDQNYYAVNIKITAKYGSEDREQKTLT